MAISVAMEEANSEQEEFDTESIGAVKAAMMGPLSGIGDAFFWGTLRVIATSIGCALAMKGNILGPILSLIHISEPTRRTPISYAVFCLKKKKTQTQNA